MLCKYSGKSEWFVIWFIEMYPSLSVAVPSTNLWTAYQSTSINALKKDKNILGTKEDFFNRDSNHEQLKFYNNDHSVNLYIILQQNALPMHCHQIRCQKQILALINKIKHFIWIKLVTWLPISIRSLSLTMIRWNLFMTSFKFWISRQSWLIQRFDSLCSYWFE